MVIDDLVAYLRERMGTGLRAVGWYTADDSGPAFVREGLSAATVEEEVEAFIDRFARAEDPSTPEPLEPLGELEATVQVRGNVVILHVPLSDTSGVFVIVEGNAAGDVPDLLAECVDRLGDETLGRRRRPVS